MKDYAKEFYKLTIWSRHKELSKEKVSQYINGLRFNIQDEVSMLKIDLVEDAYQYYLREKRRKGGGEFRGTCYKCGEVGHRSFEYPKRVSIVN